jgi:hypothetical protein
MIKTVRKSESPTNTWFGGVVWVPRAFFKKEKTIISLVKQVIIRSMAGAMDRTVKSKRISISTETCLGLSASAKPMLIVGNVRAEHSGIHTQKARPKVSTAARLMNDLFIIFSRL